MQDLKLRDQYIAQVVSGKTFAEVGGLWGTINEKLSVASQNGASSLTMIDVTPVGGELWQKFDDRMKDLSITDYRCVSADICDPKIEEIAGAFDVVHCSGVLYHHPNPMLMLAALHTITKGHLVLTSAITQEVVKNRKGQYTLPSSGVLFVPALNDQEREVLKVYWQEHAGVEVAFGLTEKVAYNVNEFGPWWWLPTAQAMLVMCESAGFKIVEHDLTWNGNALTALLEV